MIRQSVAANRTVYGSSTNTAQANSSVALARLLEKKKEIHAVMALETVSQQCVSRLEALGKDFDVMAETGEVFGQVLEHWPRMFEILQLFLASRSTEDDQEADSDKGPEGQKLVRVLIEAVADPSAGEASS